MKVLKSSLCLLLTLLLIASIAVTGVTAAQNTLTVGTVKIGGLFADRWEEQNYYYSDDYFRTSGKVLNEHLGSLSALSAFYIQQPNVATPEENAGFLKELGFEDLVYGDLDVMTSDSIGSLIGRKTVDGVPVIAVELRAEYSNEWASNFLAGNEGDAAGFAASAKKVEDRLLDYLSTRGMKKAKYWICGYSRAGAVANLLGKTINDNLDSFATTADDIYVYTYEAPRCTPDPVAYENIHNYIDENDIVPKVYPAAWPMSRHGVDVEVGDTEATIMTKEFTPVEPYGIDFKKVDRSEFLDEFVALLGTNLDRQTYVEVLEQPLNELLDVAFDLSQDDFKALGDFAKVVGEKVKDDPMFLLTMLNFIADPTSKESIKNVCDLLTRSIDAAVESEGMPVAAQVFEKITAAIPALVTALAPIIKADGLHENEDGSTVTFYYLTTAVLNALNIVTYHFNYNIFERIKMQDSYYSEGIQILGDVNGDGEVNILDVTCVQRYVSHMYLLDEAAQMRADADGDEEVTIADATLIQRYDAQMTVPEGIGQPMIGA